MPTPEQKKQLINEFSNTVKKINEFNLERDLIRKTELGESLNFEDLRTSLDEFFSLIETINSLDLDKITYTRLSRLNQSLCEPLLLFQALKTFNVANNNPKTHRDNLVSQVDQAIELFIDATIPIIAWFGSRQSNQDGSNKLNILIKKLTEENEVAAKQAKEKLAEINSVLENAKSAAGKVGVAAYSVVFAEEAKTQEAEAKKWLGYIIKMLIATAIIAIVFLIILFIPELQTSNINPVQFAISKIVVLAIFFIGISICTRNYKAHKHNAILNKHRQNALNTFETFVKAAGSDDQTKNAVLLQATQSIFSNQNTGYNSVENDSDTPNKIIEIIKSSSSKQSG